MAENLIVGLDIGTSNVRVIISNFNENSVLEIVGVGVAPSTGIRKGVVINIESTLASVAQAVEAAELMSGLEVKQVICGVSGSNVEGINSRGVVAVTGKGREITANDVGRVIDAARAVAIPMDREVLHVIPQTFIVDSQRGVKDPVDMIGVRLESEVHIITSSSTTTQNLIKCVNRAGFRVDSLVLQSLAASRACLTEDEKDLGCLLIDLGAGTTDVLVFVEGAPYYTSVIPIGGNQVTSDISVVLSVPLDAAEKIKRESTSVYLAEIDPTDQVLIPGLGGRPPSEISKAKLSSVAQPRMEEILVMVKERVQSMGHWNSIKGGVVLTGGGALMQGVCQLAHEIFGLSVRVGNPVTLGGLVEEYRSPVFSTAVGLAMMAADVIKKNPENNSSSDVKAKTSSQGGALSRFVEWLKRNFF